MELAKLILFQGWPADATLIPFGSQVYGTARADSDSDFIVLFPSGSSCPVQELRIEGMDFQIYSSCDLQAELDAHRINALEAFFVPDSSLPLYCSFIFNRTLLRHALSQKSSHSFVKAKKKLTLERDYCAGWKSLFHSLRILVFGIELAQTGRLTNFSAANAYWDEIWAAQETSWEVLQARWQPVHNALSSEFRKYAPKE